MYCTYIQYTIFKGFQSHFSEDPDAPTSYNVMYLIVFTGEMAMPQSCTIDRN